MLPPVLATPIWVVAPKHLAQHLKDLLLPSVLTAPVMILMMENAALDAIRDFLESAAGAVIDLERFAKRLAAKSNRA